MRKTKILAVAAILIMCASIFGAVMSNEAPAEPEAEATITYHYEGHSVTYHEEEAEGTRADWLSSFTYRQGITISNSGAALTDFTKRIDLNSTNGFTVAYAKSDGGDIRITDGTHTAGGYQDYWMEYWNVAHEAGGTFWVQFASIPTGSTSFYVYYGNLAATTLSNGTAVFNHFDDFTGTGYTNRNAQTDGLCGPGAMYEKAMTPVFTPDEDIYHEANGSLMGIDIGYDEAGTNWLAYGTYFNSSYAAICAASSTTGTGSWTRAAFNPIINHSTSGDDPDFNKATEPNFVNWLNDTYRKKLYHDADFHLLYSAFNQSNISICHAYKDSIDAKWTKTGVVLPGGPVGHWNQSVRSPVVFCEGETDFKLFFAASGDDNTTWEIGYAQSTAVNGPYTETYDFPVLNTSAWGWRSDSVTPQDIFKVGSKYYLVISGMDSNLDWRIGIATCDDDVFLDWDVWAGVICLGNNGTWDAHDCVFGTVNMIDREGEDEYMQLYHTGKNATWNTQMGYAVLRNTSWQHRGTDVSCFSLYNDGLRIDYNETLLQKEVNDDENSTVAVDFWPKTNQHNNLSVVARASTDAWAGRDHYAGQVGTENDTADIIEAANGAETVHNETSISLDNQFQYILAVSSHETNITGFSESMYNNNSASSTISDATLTDGEAGIQTKIPNPLQFDWFRVNGYSGASTGTTYATQGTYTPPAAATGGGGGGFIDVDVPVLDTNETSDDSTCCLTTGGIIALPLMAVGLATYGGRRREKCK